MTPVEVKVQKAMHDVDCIRDFWRERFRGKWQRRDPPKAQQIAADRHGLDVGDVESAINNRTRD